LFSRDVIHKTAPLEVLFDGCNNSIVFNIIKTNSNLIILGFSWLERYNLFVDWKVCKIMLSLELFLIETIKKPQRIITLLIEARVLMKGAKKSTPFAIYAIPT